MNRTADAGSDSVPTETTGRASTNVREAIRLYEQGDFANAEKIARSIVLASPNDLQASAILVSVLAEQGEYSSAISMLDGMAAVQLNQQDEIGAQAADLAYQSGEVNDAIGRFEHLIRRSPLHHFTTSPLHHAATLHAATPPRRHAATPPRRHAATPPRRHAATPRGVA